MKLYLLPFTFLALWSGYSQYSIRGLVYDAASQEPLEQVSVYLPQLEKGTISDAGGVFEITNLPAGSYKIVASYIGYKTFSEAIEIGTDGINLNVPLWPSAIEMEEVIISTPFHKLQRENVMKVEQARISELKDMGSITLADGITNVPGVESVSTGIGVGKPVIRGLSSNRVVVYTQGVRLENQQFGDEHGLGVNDAGISSVEVIKGPASLLYGSDALGGVIYLNPEKYAVAGTTDGDLSLNYFSNTEGFSGNAGVKSSGEKFKFLLRAASATHADYKNGNGQLVTNSRFREFDLKSGAGYQTSRLKTELRYNYNRSEIGIPEAIATQSRDRSPELPFQEIDNHILSSDTDLFFKSSSLRVTLGYLYNDRKEFEEEAGRDRPALHMKLATLNYNLQYHLPKSGKLESIIGIQGMRQTNDNLGEEVLIPDATTNDFGILATSHLHFEKSDMQFGLRFDHREISGSENGNIGEEGYIPRIGRNFNSLNAALGLRKDISEAIIGRINLASGFRAPNLAELTSNGVHEGTNRYEIGDPNLENEQNFQTDLALEYKNEHFECYVNAFYNYVNNYIFLEPNGEFVGEDAVFIYRQQNASLYGGEFGLHIHPHPLDWLHIETSFETVTGTLNGGGNLPLIPANSLKNTLRVEFANKQSFISSSYAFIGVNLIFDQNRVSTFETPTNGYTLLNMGIGGEFEIFDNAWELRMSANNLLNQSYISHLSRLKQDGIANIGRNISVGLRIPI